MEKILEFEEGKGFRASKVYRLQCDCLSPSDAMDLEVEPVGLLNERKWVSITMYFNGTGLWDRIKYAFAILRGHWAWRGFIPREEDYSNLRPL